MGRTFVRQDEQIGSTTDSLTAYDETITLNLANFETNPDDLAQDLNNIRSAINYARKADQSLQWYDQQTVPTALETGTARGVDDLNDGLHAVEKKRVLKCVFGLKSITIASAGDTFDILGTGELPGNTTAAVGAVTTLGTVVAAHGGTFGTHSVTEVGGPTAISPKNLVQIVDAVTRDPVLDAGDRIYGLLQSETATDGHTITDTTTTRVQISFVKSNGTDLVAISSGAMDGVSYDYCYVERVRLEDLNEADFLGGANVDVPAGATVTRQAGYDNQGTTPVDVTTNSTLDLEGAGLTWTIRDDLEAMLFQVVEGSAGGTSQLNIGADVDELDIDAVATDFANGVTIDSGSASPITVGVTDGHVETTAGDLHLQAAAEIFLDDVNQTGSTWAQTDGIKLSETTAEWDTFESNFGEVSLLNAINQAAATAGARRKVVSVMTANVAADTDVSGPSNDNNMDADLGDLSAGTFVTDYDIFLNGVLLRNGADASANHDVYPGTALANGQLRFEFPLKGTGTRPDVITVIDWAA